MDLELLGVELGFFEGAGPDDGLFELMDFHHHTVCGFLVVAEDFHEDEGDVVLEVYGVVMNDNVPGGVCEGCGMGLWDGDGFGIGHFRRRWFGCCGLVRSICRVL